MRLVATFALLALLASPAPAQAQDRATLPPGWEHIQQGDWHFEGVSAGTMLHQGVSVNRTELMFSRGIETGPWGERSGLFRLEFTARVGSHEVRGSMSTVGAAHCESSDLSLMDLTLFTVPNIDQQHVLERHESWDGKIDGGSPFKWIYDRLCGSPTAP